MKDTILFTMKKHIFLIFIDGMNEAFTKLSSRAQVEVNASAQLQYSMGYKVECVSKQPVLFGESPLWDNRRGQLVFTDCFGKSVCLYDPTTQDIVKKEVKPRNEELIFTVASVPYASDPGKFVVTTSSDKFVEFDWDKDEVTRVLFETPDPTAGLKYNDIKCDEKGRLWTGAGKFSDLATLKMEENKGELYKLSVSPDQSKLIPSTEGGGFDLPNGLGINKEQTKIFWNDIARRVVNVFDFDVENGKLENGKILLDYKDHSPSLDGSQPDGLCVDATGNVWIANWKGGSVIKVDGQTGKLVDKIDIPVPTTTSVGFGGDNYSQLFVTTTSILLDQTPVPAPQAGKLFKITRPQDKSFKGFQEHFFNI